MIGDDDFFMQNADYHYGANDSEKMYGRGYDGSSSYIPGYVPGSYGSASSKESSEDDGTGKYCLAVILIILAIIVMANVVVPAVTDAMSNSVAVDDLKITRYIYSTQYESKVSTDVGYEITYNEDGTEGETVDHDYICGVSVSADNAWVQATGMYPDTDVVVGVIANTKHKDLAKAFLIYLLENE